MTSTQHALLAVVAAGLLAGCSAASQATGTGTPTASGAGSRTILVTDADNGRRLDVHVGDVITLRLSSTYWQLGAPGGAILRAQGRPSVVPSGGCVPGGGCGTVSERFTVVATGDGRLSASRRSCGEALRCSRQQGSFAVSVTAQR